jgi:hypothetical protein
MGQGLRFAGLVRRGARYARCDMEERLEREGEEEGLPRGREDGGETQRGAAQRGRQARTAATAALRVRRCSGAVRRNGEIEARNWAGCAGFSADFGASWVVVVLGFRAASSGRRTVRNGLLTRGPWLAAASAGAPRALGAVALGWGARQARWAAEARWLGRAACRRVRAREGAERGAGWRGSWAAAALGARAGPPARSWAAAVERGGGRVGCPKWAREGGWATFPFSFFFLFSFCFLFISV